MDNKIREIADEDLSMLPLLHPGDKVFVKNEKTYHTGDIVVFLEKDKLIAHRIIYEAKDFFITKGDNNYKSDGKISKNKVLGKVARFKRKKQTIELEHLYLSQSSIYLSELKKIAKTLTTKNIKHVFLKGLPLHLEHIKSPPKRIYQDADILIKRKGRKRTIEVLKNLGFVLKKPELFGEHTKSSQLTLFKNTKPFRTVIDLHIEPAIGFTKATFLNALIPGQEKYNKLLFEKIKNVKVEGQNFPILEEETFLVYLLLHLFHHNFQGYHRLEFINKFTNKAKLNLSAIKAQIKNFKLENYIIPSLLILGKYYKNRTAIRLLGELGIGAQKFKVRLIAKLIKPFDTHGRALEGIKRAVLIFILSPVSLRNKLKMLTKSDFYRYLLLTIKSIFAKA